VTPEAVRPRQTVTATVATDEPIDDVTSATLEWGYDNFYRAGPADSAGDDDWVCVTRIALDVVAREFAGASSTFKIPPWAPASSPQIARWSCRLVVDRDGPDVDSRGDFTVVIGTADVEAYEEPLERLSGSGDTEIDIALDSPVYLAGGTISGQIVLRPRMDLPNGDVAVHWQRHRESHPLGRDPAEDEVLDGPIIRLDNRIALTVGAPATLPFTLPLPPDAAPSAEAVHSSLSWFVAVRMLHAGQSGQEAERVRRPIVVVNAP
jgi:hypothetical protein